jgi:hypothetical protein
MNTTQRPNFVLVCIAVVLLSFSFAGEMLCSSIQRTALLAEPRDDDNSTAPQQAKVSDYLTAMPSRVHPFASFAPSALATDADRHSLTGALLPPLPAEIGGDNQLIESLEQSSADAVEASSKVESVSHNHQVAYNLNFVADNSRGNNVRSTNSAATKSRRLMAKSDSAKHKVVAIAVSIKQSGYGAFLPSRLLNKQAQLKLKRAIEKINLGESAKRKLKIALLESGHQDLIELKQEGTETSAKDKLISFLKKLTGCSVERKIYVLKNLSAEKIEALKQILNAHNITLRAFIKA